MASDFCKGFVATKRLDLQICKDHQTFVVVILCKEKSNFETEINNLQKKLRQPTKININLKPIIKKRSELQPEEEETNSKKRQKT